MTKAEIERAIRTLEVCVSDTLSVSNDKSYSDGARKKAKELYEEYGTALAALQEAKKREDGCDACEDNGAYLSCGYQRQTSEDESEQFGFSPTYCPNCGRRLATNEESSEVREEKDE